MCKIMILFSVIEELASFMSDKRHLYSSCLTPEVKTEAFFTITKQHNIGLIKLTFNVYEITTDSKMFIEPIRTLVKDELYKEVNYNKNYIFFTLILFYIKKKR